MCEKPSRLGPGRDFPGGPVVKTLLSSAGGTGSFPGRGAKIPRASQPKNQKHKNGSNIVTNSIKTLKMVHIKEYFKKRLEPGTLSAPGYKIRSFNNKLLSYYMMLLI